MQNYICLNNVKTPLTEEQMKALGIISAKPSIKELAEAIESGKARELYKVHDIIEVDGKEYEIIGFDHDKASRDKTLPTVTLISKTLLPPRRMHDGACERGWIDTGLRDWLNHEYYYVLSVEIRDYIYSVTKYTHDYKGNMHEAEDFLFIPSESELHGSAIYSGYEDGPHYEAFATSDNSVRSDENGDGDWYWTRSAKGGYSTNFARVSTNGGARGNVATTAGIRVPLCFVIA